VRRTATGKASGPERRTTEMAPVPPGVAGATIVSSSRIMFSFYCDGPAESPQEGAPHSRTNYTPWGTPTVGRTGGTVRPASRVPFPKSPCTERGDAPPPARRPTEAYPLRYGEGGERCRGGCSGPRMPGSEGMEPWRPVRSRAGSPHGEPRTESPSEAAQPIDEPWMRSVFRDRSLESLPPECCIIHGSEHYAVTAFAASALRLYIICCPMARTLLTSQ